jgi:hypothetical protein
MGCGWCETDGTCVPGTAMGPTGVLPTQCNKQGFEVYWHFNECGRDVAAWTSRLRNRLDVDVGKIPSEKRLEDMLFNPQPGDYDALKEVTPSKQQTPAAASGKNATQAITPAQKAAKATSTAKKAAAMEKEAAKKEKSAKVAQDAARVAEKEAVAADKEAQKARDERVNAQKLKAAQLNQDAKKAAAEASDAEKSSKVKPKAKIAAKN